MSSKKKTTATKDDAKPALVPKLRFPDFQEAEGWECIPLNQLAVRINQKNRDEKIDRVLTNSAEFGVVDQRDFFDKDIATQGRLEGYFVVELGSYVYNPRISSTAPVVPISKNKIGTGVMSPLYTVFRFKDDSNEFLEHFFKTTGWHNYMREAASTGARHDRMAISSDDFMAMPLPVASPAEQQKIAECLSSVDELMAAQARKVDALKTHKKGLMQQLFPREGETQPRLRFPEFQNAGEWEVKAIGDVFRVTRGEVLSMTLVKEEASEEAPFPVYSSQTKNKGLAGYYSEHLYEDAITWTTDGANAGDVNFRPGKFYCTNVCGVLINTNGYANACIAALLNSVTRSHVSYVGNPKLMNGVMAKIEIPFPPVAEQQRIATCLSSLDALITAESQKLETLKTHKKGLMQQLFPSPEEVAA